MPGFSGGFSVVYTIRSAKLPTLLNTSFIIFLAQEFWIGLSIASTFAAVQTASGVASRQHFNSPEAHLVSTHYEIPRRSINQDNPDLTPLGPM